MRCSCRGRVHRGSTDAARRVQQNWGPARALCISEGLGGANSGQAGITLCSCKPRDQSRSWSAAGPIDTRLRNAPARQPLAATRSSRPEPEPDTTPHPRTAESAGTRQHGIQPAEGRPTTQWSEPDAAAASIVHGAGVRCPVLVLGAIPASDDSSRASPPLLARCASAVAVSAAVLFGAAGVRTTLAASFNLPGLLPAIRGKRHHSVKFRPMS